MEKNSKIYVAGHRGLVGSAIVRCLQAKGYSNIVTKTHSELDLLNQEAVNAFFANEKPDYVFLAAAHVGGIGANSTYPADFIYRNMMIGFNVVEASRQNGVKKLMNLGSTCIYPKMAEQPIKEESLLTGALEPTNDAYALAKISVIKLCTAYNKQHGTNFLSVMPTNLYGPGDNYELQGSHVLPAMIRKFHEAKINKTDKVELWGAQGADFNSINIGGSGSYTSGDILLETNKRLYIYVGSAGIFPTCSTNITTTGGYNGGGYGSNGGNYSCGWRNGGGGGATDVRYLIAVFLMLDDKLQQ